jgi:hypothetical protein
MILKNEKLDVKINYLEEKSKNRERTITAIFVMMLVSLGLVMAVSGLAGIQSALTKDIITTKYKRKGLAIQPLYSLFLAKNNAIAPLAFKNFIYLLSLILHYIFASIIFFLT